MQSIAVKITNCNAFISERSGVCKRDNGTSIKKKLAKVVGKGFAGVNG
jgi:hypothetical protein